MMNDKNRLGIIVGGGERRDMVLPPTTFGLWWEDTWDVVFYNVNKRVVIREGALELVEPANSNSLGLLKRVKKYLRRDVLRFIGPKGRWVMNVPLLIFFHASYALPVTIIGYLIFDMFA